MRKKLDPVLQQQQDTINMLAKLMKHFKLGSIEMDGIKLVAGVQPEKKPHPVASKAAKAPVAPKLTPREIEVMNAKELFELATHSGTKSISPEDFVKSYLSPTRFRPDTGLPPEILELSKDKE